MHRLNAKNIIIKEQLILVYDSWCTANIHAATNTNKQKIDQSRSLQRRKFDTISAKNYCHMFITKLTYIIGLR